MTEDERLNEHLKLAANWANTLATAIITAGTFIPAAQFIFGILPPTANLTLIYGSGAICIGIGIIIHWGGHAILRILK